VFESQNAAPEGQVFRQLPPVGTSVQEHDQVTLFVSQGPGTPTPTATATP
jgi:beta-lactam-binding protein with PASTA domain